MEIIYKDEHLVVSKKPSGVLSEGESTGAMPALLAAYLEENGEKNVKIYPVHRLDKETEGLMVYARNSKSAASLSASITDGSFKKKYLAVLCGAPEADSGRLEDLLFFDRQRGKTFVVERERRGVKKAILEYTVLKKNDKYTLVSISLLTGRTHQIRAQFASRGTPLVGDRRYGAPKDSGNRLALLSCELSFPHPSTGAPMMFQLEDAGDAKDAKDAKDAIFTLF